MVFLQSVAIVILLLALETHASYDHRIVMMLTPRPAEEGSNVTLRCEKQDLNIPSGESVISWTLNGSVIAEGDVVLSNNPRISAQNDVDTGYLTITSFGREDAGVYACAHTASCSEFRVLHFISIAVLKENRRTGIQTAIRGLYAFKKMPAVLNDDYRLVCRFKDEPGVRSTQWFFNDVPLEEHPKGTLRVKTHLVGDGNGENVMTLNVEDFDDTQVGMYRCQVTYENSLVDAELLIMGAALTINAEEKVVTAVPGSKVELACKYSSTPPLTECYTEWLFNGTRLIDHEHILLKASEAKNVTANGQFEMRLTLEDFGEEMFGKWTCQVNNTREVAEATIRLRRESAWWQVMKDVWSDVKGWFITS